MKTDKMTPMVTIGERCIICGHIFIKKHPKDYRCICEKCSDKIAKLIGIGGDNANENSDR